MGADQDNREFFRIEDQVALNVSIDDQSEGASSLPVESPLFDLLGELHLLDYESQHLLRQISDRDRLLAAYLKIVNKRIDLLGRTLATQLNGELGPLQQVSISEGGLSFLHHCELPVGAALKLDLVLLPSPLGLRLRGRVIHSQPETGGWLTGVTFESISDAQRQLLARHIMQKQAQEIRASKQLEGSTP